MQKAHQEIYDNMKKNRRKLLKLNIIRQQLRNSIIESNPEKQKKAHKRYRDKNKAKRVETARLYKLKKEVRNSGESNEVEIERHAKELMEERKRR